MAILQVSCAQLSILLSLEFHFSFFLGAHSQSGEHILQANVTDKSVNKGLLLSVLSQGSAYMLSLVKGNI